MAALDNIHSLTTSLGPINGTERTAQTDESKDSSLKATAGATAAPRGQDQTSVSTAAGLVAQTAGSPDVRLDKVSALQAAIAGGTYKVSAGDVASKIVDSLLS